MKKILKLTALTALIISLVACGNSKDFSKMKFKDGVYVGKSEGGEPVSYTVVKLEIKDNKIIKSEAEFMDFNKKIKDESYCKEIGGEKYQIAQKAVKGMNQYANMLLEIQNPDFVDVVSGATISHKLFKEAAWNALESARK